jgi:hypothetical protein
MVFNFSMLHQIRRLWQLKTVIFLHRYLMGTVLFALASAVLFFYVSG